MSYIKLTDELKTLLDSLNQSNAYWDNGFTNPEYLNHLINNDQNIPQNVINYVNSIPITQYLGIDESELLSDPQTGEIFISDEATGLNVSKSIYSLMFGDPSSNQYLEIGDVNITNFNGPVFNQDLLIKELIITKQDTRANRNLSLRYSDINGRNSEILTTISINEENNRFKTLENTNLILPKRKRLWFLITGGNCSNIICTIFFKKIIE